VSGPVLALRDVVVRAGGRVILEVTAIAMAPGEVVALLGANGAGKTTLLHVAALLRWPERGVVSIGGQDATARNAAVLRRSLSVVFQDPLLFEVSVLDNAAAGLRFQGLSRSEARRRAQFWLQRFGVDHLARRRARTLSGGEASRVALARAFATDPAILLLDEPFAALDAPTRAELLPALRERLRQSGAAALLVTHDLDEAFAFGDEIALMQSGRVLARGAGAALLARPPNREAAELLGIETILAAKIEASDAGSVLLGVLPDGPCLRAVVPSDSAPQVGEVVTITLPAAAARVLRRDEVAPTGWNRLAGRIAAASPLPTGKRLTIETPAPIVALAPWHPVTEVWAMGEAAAVTFPPAAVHVILGEK
jgi:tungstate transport system ATP-binding protein